MHYFKLLFACWLLLLPTTASANSEILITDSAVKLDRFELEYYIDHEQQLTVTEVQDKSFAAGISHFSFGTSAKTLWLKFSLQNETDTAKTLFLHQNTAYHNRQIDLYQFNRDGLQQQQHIDLDNAADNPLMIKGIAVFPIALAPHEHKTIFARIEVYSHQWGTLQLYDGANSKYALVGTNNGISLLVGILIALFIYNFLLYYSSHQTENIFYSLYLISGALWIALSYGWFANEFELYGSTIFMLNIALITMPIFLLLFLTQIFQTKSRYPTEHKFLWLLIVVLLLNLLYAFIDIQSALKPASTLAALMMLVTVSVTISFYRKKDPLAKYFLIGHSMFIAFNLIAVLFYKGHIEYNTLTSHGVGIGIMLEALTLAFIIAYRIKLFEELRNSHAEMAGLASTDPLTKLYNRRYFFTQSEFQISVAHKQKQPISILMIDIDKFKALNDNYGHAFGDQVLTELAQIFKQLSRHSDIIARLGGEEFVILLPNSNLDGAVKVAQKIRNAVEKHTFLINPHTVLNSTVSIGVTQLYRDESSIETALNRADQALYQAKHGGRNTVISLKDDTHFPIEETALNI